MPILQPLDRRRDPVQNRQQLPARARVEKIHDTAQDRLDGVRADLLVESVLERFAVKILGLQLVGDQIANHAQEGVFIRDHRLEGAAVRLEGF